MPKERMLPIMKFLNNNISEMREWFFNLMIQFAERIALVENKFKKIDDIKVFFLKLCAQLI